MKALIITTFFSLFLISLSAQHPGDRYLDFGENGIVDESWVDTHSYIYDIGVLSDGNLIAAGHYKPYISTNMKSCVLKIDRLGNLLQFGNFSHGYELDLSDNTDRATAISILPDDKIVVGGFYKGSPSVQPYVMLLFPENGQPDGGFGTDGVFTDESIFMEEGYAMGICQLDNSYKIILGGQNESENPQLLMIDDEGIPESDFGDEGIVVLDEYSGYISDMAIDNKNSSLYVSGIMQYQMKTFIAKYDLASGNLDTDFAQDGILIDTNFLGICTTLVLDTVSNTITAFGSYDPGDTDMDVFAYRIHANDGTTDVSFGLGGWATIRSAGSNEYLSSAILQSDGKYYYGGNTNIMGTEDFFLGRLTPNGYADTAFGNNGVVIDQLEYDQYLKDIALSPAEDMLYAAGAIDAPGVSGNSIMVAAYHTGNESELSISTDYNHGSAIACFPNPTAGLVTIETEGADLFQIQVFDIAGRELITKNYTGKRVDLDLEFLQSSIYFLRVTMHDKQMKTIRLIKQ